MPYGMMTMEPEFSFYSKDTNMGTISTELASKLGASNTTFYGLGSKVMCQILTNAYYGKN